MIPNITNSTKIAIIGAGLIGRSWAICFARAGFPVALFDHVDGVADKAIESICCDLKSLEELGLLDCQESSSVVARITVAPSLAEAVAEAGYVQENTPEKLDVKRKIFEELRANAPTSTIIASSTSALLPSQFTSTLDDASNCLVAHPLNPPHLIPAIEIVPHPGTSQAAIDFTRDLMIETGQAPVVANHEIEGFIMNRLQGAVLDEAFSLLFKGVASVEDIDVAMSQGLARRWSFMGPFETIDLNAPDGVAGFFARYADAYARIGSERPERIMWQDDIVEQVSIARRKSLPEAQIEARQAWRDQQLAKLASHFSASKKSKD